MKSSTTYIHGTDPVEQARLGLMNELLNGPSLRELQIRQNERILDVGCGLGQFSRMMARIAGARVVAIDNSEEQLHAARSLAEVDGESGLIEFRPGDALELPLKKEEWGSFDLVHARFILEHVDKPLRVVEQMRDAAAPGGRIVLEDDDHDLLRLTPTPPGLTAVWEAYCRSYDRNRTDPYIGRNLVSLLHRAGLKPRRSTWLFFGACSGDDRLQICVDNLVGILRGARSPILALGSLDAEYFDRAMRVLEEWKSRPDAFFGYAIPWVEGIRNR
jgi:SAM-dependent methyltransferase